MLNLFNKINMFVVGATIHGMFLKGWHIGFSGRIARSRNYLRLTKNRIKMPVA
jgi:hypothetical protein